KAYYDAHAKDFTSPEMVKLFVAQVAKTPSVTDQVLARDTAKEVLQELTSGHAFADVAKASSEGPWAADGGMSPQPIPVERLSPVVRAALDQLQPGQTSGLVPEPAQIHILKLDSRSTTTDGKPAVKYGDIVTRVRAGDETLRIARDKVNDLLQRAKKVGLQQAAADIKVPAGA